MVANLFLQLKPVNRVKSRQGSKRWSPKLRPIKSAVRGGITDEYHVGKSQDRFSLIIGAAAAEVLICRQ